MAGKVRHKKHEYMAGKVRHKKHENGSFLEKNF